MSNTLQGENYYVEVSAEPLDCNKYIAWVSDPSAGAISTFHGVTRNNFQGKAVIKLEYEAYVPMALKKLKVSLLLRSFSPLGSRGFDMHDVPVPSQELCIEVHEKWSVVKVAIAHRTGTVAVMEPSVIIAVSSAHRRESLEVRADAWVHARMHGWALTHMI